MKLFNKSSAIYLLFQVVTSKVLLSRNELVLDTLIFHQCHQDYDTIIVSDNSKELNSSQIQQLHEQFYSVIFFDQKLVSKVQPNLKRIDAALIVTQSSIKLAQILTKLSTAMRWNVMMPVYILKLPDDDCKDVMTILRRMWKHQILTSYFLCIKNNEVQINTYNPFTNRAPNGWKKLRSSADEPRWTLFQRKYQDGIKCQELHFDRTKFLDGYPMTVAYPATTKASFSSIGKLIDYNDLSTHAGIISDRKQIIIDALVIDLNVTLRLYVFKHIRNYKENSTSVWVQKKKIYENSSATLIFIQQRLKFSNTLSSKIYLFTQTYPLPWSEYSIATYNRGYQTLAEKLWDFYGFEVIMFTIFVLFITFAVIWFTENGMVWFATSEIIRLLINHSLYTRMNTQSLRIFFITIFFYFLIVQATFNGHLAKFLTKPELRRHPDTRKELEELGYTKVYDEQYVKKYLAVTDHEKRLGTSQTRLCLDYMLYNDSSVACVADREVLLVYSKRRRNLYVSKKASDTRYKVFSIHKHSPLADRVNRIFLFIEEFGFRQLNFNDFLKSNVINNSSAADDSSDHEFQPIKMENLIFSFSILAIGLISAAFSFLVEVFNSRLNQFNMTSRINSVREGFVMS